MRKTPNDTVCRRAIDELDGALADIDAIVRLLWDALEGVPDNGDVPFKTVPPLRGTLGAVVEKIMLAQQQVEIITVTRVA